MIYNTPNQAQQLLQAQKLMPNAVSGRRHKSTVRGLVGGPLQGMINIGQHYDSAASLHG
jgi:hypothetical protein